MSRVLAYNGDRVIAELRGELFLVNLESDPTDDSATKISADRSQNLMSRSGWSDSVPSAIMVRVGELLS